MIVVFDLLHLEQQCLGSFILYNFFYVDYIELEEVKTKKIEMKAHGQILIKWKTLGSKFC